MGFTQEEQDLSSRYFIKNLIYEPIDAFFVSLYTIILKIIRQPLLDLCNVSQGVSGYSILFNL